MRSWLGIDVGTSAVKADLVDDDQTVVAEATVPLSTIRLKPGWSEKDPDDWEGAVEEAMTGLARSAPDAFKVVAGIGLSGQMHAALLLGSDDRPLRPIGCLHESVLGTDPSGREMQPKGADAGK